MTHHHLGKKKLKKKRQKTELKLKKKIKVHKTSVLVTNEQEVGQTVKQGILERGLDDNLKHLKK